MDGFDALDEAQLVRRQARPAMVTAAGLAAIGTIAYALLGSRR